MRIKNLVAKIKVPEGVKAEVDGKTVTVKGMKGEHKRTFICPGMKIELLDNMVVISVKDARKSDKTAVGTTEAHLNNMMKGVSEGHVYKMKICSGHFPMTVATSGNDFTITNFLGEKTPRKLKIKEGATVKVAGTEIVIESAKKETAGQVAADIETLARIRGRDKRIFQDGIYIVYKDGKEVQ
jgi:large subunit ribosomal protein L6